MGAGSSAEQAESQDRAQDSEVNAEPEPQSQQDPGAGDAKLLQKNGQVSNANGTEEEQAALACQSVDVNGQQDKAVIIDVEQREPANVTQKDELAGNMEVAPAEESNKAAVENGQKDDQEANEEMTVLEENVEDQEQTSELQSNEVGFKKVFKFVGFKFTMKKEKTEKSEPVQLLTVKKDEVEANGTHECEEVKSDMPEEAKPDEDMTDLAEKADEAPQSGDSPEDLLPEKVDEATNDQAENIEVAEEKEPNKSPESSPTNPVVNETSSSFKRFFTQGWAGLRKKTSFKKSKEEEPQVAKKNEKEEQEEKDVADALLEAVEEREMVVEKDRPSDEQLLPQEIPESVNQDSKVSIVEKQPEECKITEKAEVPTDEKSEQAEECNKLQAVKAEIFTEDKLEQDEEWKVSQAMMTETITGKLDKKDIEVPISTVEVKEEGQVTDPKLAVDCLNVEQSSEVIPKVQEVEPSGELPEAKEISNSVAEDHIQQTESRTEHISLHKTPEGISSEADLLSSQEKMKLQGSPLKKLFTGSGLKRLSGKKQKGKKEEDSKVEETVEHLHPLNEHADCQVEEKGDSSPSSPEELTEISSVEKAIVDEAQNTETEGEGTTSDGEKKKDGITTWASFKKLVTPKKRVKRPSESDKEDEPEKPKSATMSSTDSAASVENHEENKINGEEQKLDKSTEETKRKVDSSVSWEALICVGSSKKRGKKSSESDEEEAQKPLEDNQKTDDEAIRSKEAETTLASAQELNQAQGSPSPEQAGSPSEGEGVSTWESFKRLVTPRKKSKTKMEDKVEESAVALTAEHSTSDGEPGKEESWVSFKKLIPGRKKKKSDGKQEYASAERVVEEAAEEDSDVPAVVPLSEYEAAEQEKTETLQAAETRIIKKEIAAKDHAAKEDSEEPSEGLMHAVTVTLVEGARAVTSIEERSPSWISATVTESIEQANECEEIQQSRHPIETEVIVEETIVVIKTVPQTTKEISEDLVTSETEITHEAVTALEEAAEISFAEETTEMVSAVSQLSESPVTTEEATPVQEEEESQKSLEDLKKQTQEVLQEVAEKVRLSEEAHIEIELKDEKSEEVKIIVQSPVIPEGFEEKELKETEIKQVENSSRSIEGIKEVEESICEGESKMIVETYCLTEKCVPEVGNYEVNEEGVILFEKQNDLHEEAIKHQVTGQEEKEKIFKVEEKPDLEEKALYSSATVTAIVESQPEVKTDIEIVECHQKTAAEQDQAKVNDVTQNEITDDSCLVVSSKHVNNAKTKFTKDLGEMVASSSILKSKVVEEAKYKPSVKPEAVQEQVSYVYFTEDSVTEKFQEPVEPIKSLQELELAQKSVVTPQPEEIKENECKERMNVAVLQSTHAIKEGKSQEGLHRTPEDQTVFLDIHQDDGSEIFRKDQVTAKSGTNKDLCGSEINEFKGKLQEEITDGPEEAVITDIPEIESREARRSSIPVTAAAVEEQVVAETVVLMQTYVETVETVDVDEDFIVVQADEQVAECEEPVIESMSQTAAAIVDAAIEAATISLNDDGLDNNILAEKHNEESAENDDDLQEKREPSQAKIGMQKDESSFTVVQKIVQTAVEEVAEITQEIKHTKMSSVPHDDKITVAHVPEFQETLQTAELAMVKHAEETLASEEMEVHQLNIVNHVVAEKMSEEQNSIEHTEDETVPDISEDIALTFQEREPKPWTQVSKHMHEDAVQLTKEAGDAPKREQDLKEECLKQEESEVKSQTEVTSESLADRRAVVDTSISEEKSREFQDTVEENLTVKDVDQIVEIQEEQLAQQVADSKQVLSQIEEAKMDVLHKVYSQEDESLGRTKEQSESTES